MTWRRFVQNWTELWSLYRRSQSFSCRPSDLLGLDDPYAAWCLDAACYDFGSALESEISRVEGKNQKEVDMKVDRLVRRWLDMPLQYRNPMSSGAVELPKASG